MNATVLTITDPELLAKLAAAEGQIVFRGPNGDIVTTVYVVPDEEPGAGRKASEGAVTLDEVWKRIHDKYGKK